jgi:hypothetical protein
MAETNYTIELFSGGEKLQHWYSSEPPQSSDNGFTFTDLSTGEKVQITGTVIITHH